MQRKNVRDKFQSFRISDDEKKMIDQKAKAMFPGEKNCTSLYIRYRVLDAETGQTEILKKELKEIKYQMRKIGVNVNQIAKIANQTDYIYQKEFTDIARQLLQKTEEVDKKISALLKIRYNGDH